MSNAVTITIDTQGTKEVQAALKNVRKSIQNRVIMSALRYAIKPIVPAVKRAVPVRFGSLRKSIGTKVKKYKKAVFAAIGPRTDFQEYVNSKNFWTGKEFVRRQVPALYAHLVEDGALPHTMYTPTGVPFRHPGANAQPFIQPTQDMVDRPTQQRFRDHVLKRIKIEYDKAMKKGRRFFDA